jgi:tetratricopeptide (TPR) repeat protein
MKFVCLATVMASHLSAQVPNLYPQVRALALEAEAASGRVGILKDHSDPRGMVGDILAHAGYLEDAERAFAKAPSYSSGTPSALWRAWVVYGHPEKAQKLIESTTNTEKQAGLSASLADLLWRLGQPGEARARFEAARGIAAKIIDPAKRKQSLTAIDQGLQYVSLPPPYFISAIPHPRPRPNVQESAIPPFPITADGFEDPDSRDSGALANAEFIKRLYARAAAGDREGIESVTASAATPFQRALGVASLEHILIQARQPKSAEEYANKIEQTDSPSSLAKAEALSAAASAWLRAADGERARTDFEAAKQIVLGVQDLPVGKISVLSSIAAAQIKGGMMEEGHATFEIAVELAMKLSEPPRPRPGGPRPRKSSSSNSRGKALEKILRTAIRAQDLQVAADVGKRWIDTGEVAGWQVASAWFAEGTTEQAIAAARQLTDENRITALLTLARGLLTEEGGPIF